MTEQEDSRWRPSRRQLLWAGGIAALAFLIVVICGYLFGWKWTGFGGRTLWDWLKLLLAVAVPAVIAIFGQRISTLQYRGQQEAEQNRAQDEALQAYLGEMGNLMLEQGLGRSQENDAFTPQAIEEIRTLARARTLTLVRTLAADRKRSVVDFLYEAKLIVGRPTQQGIVDLGGIDRFGGAADLSSADLEGDHLAEADFSGANLTAANLREANLQEANLAEAYLSDANLSGAELLKASLSVARLRNANLSKANLSMANIAQADLRDADLSNAALYETKLNGANLSGASLEGIAGGLGIYNDDLQAMEYFSKSDLIRANLSRANLREASLREANLSNADLQDADLSRADLTGAEVTEEQLTKCASLEGATMPNGQKYEDWLKNTDRSKEARKNE